MGQNKGSLLKGRKAEMKEKAFKEEWEDIGQTGRQAEGRHVLHESTLFT